MTYGIFRRPGEPARAGLRSGERVLDLAAAGAPYESDFTLPVLNAFMSRGRPAWREVWQWARTVAPDHPAWLPLDGVEVLLPCRIGDYTDFYASIFHATNVGSMFRPDNPLLPNYKHVPIAYHGRASSIVPSGTPVRRPCGQLDAGVFGPSKQLDYELELGVFIGGGNALGEPVPVDRAGDLVFGFALVNDWSARDIQRWEYQPLGPLLAKNFATTISPWITPTDAVEHLRVPAFERADDDPRPLPYLHSDGDQRRGGFDIDLEVWLNDTLVSRGSFRHMYWTIAQMIAHHTSNGCNLQPGDLLASGTVSGPEPDTRGCLLERTWRGTEPLTLRDGSLRTFLEDGDEVVFRGTLLEECRGRILPALTT